MLKNTIIVLFALSPFVLGAILLLPTKSESNQQIENCHCKGVKQCLNLK